MTYVMQALGTTAPSGRRATSNALSCRGASVRTVGCSCSVRGLCAGQSVFTPVEINGLVLAGSGVTVWVRTIGGLVACVGLNCRWFLRSGWAKSAAREMQLPCHSAEVEACRRPVAAALPAVGW